MGLNSVAGVLQAVEAVAPLHLQSSWDKGGVQVAGAVQQISRLAVMLDPQPDTVAAALDWGAQFLLSHHPLALAPRLPDRTDGFRAVLKAVLGADAWLYAAHTSLDVQPAGPAGWLAREFGLANPMVLEPVANGAGFGTVGDLPAPLALQDFLGRLGSLLGREAWLAAGLPPATVRRLAYCPGSGGSLAAAALAQGADVYVTGEVRHHQALEAANAPCLVLDVGHFCLEDRMMRAFQERLAADLGPMGIETAYIPAAEPLTFATVGRAAGRA